VCEQNKDDLLGALSLHESELQGRQIRVFKASNHQQQQGGLKGPSTKSNSKVRVRTRETSHHVSARTDAARGARDDRAPEPSGHTRACSQCRAPRCASSGSGSEWRTAAVVAVAAVAAAVLVAAVAVAVAVPVAVPVAAVAVPGAAAGPTSSPERLEASCSASHTQHELPATIHWFISTLVCVIILFATGPVGYSHLPLRALHSRHQKLKIINIDFVLF
jgi:hypothetical protein